MGFASAYINERALFPPLFIEAPDKNLGIIVVIPAYNESGITTVLDSLAKCKLPLCSTEVIIIINAPADASEESFENNQKTFENIRSWKKQNVNCFFQLLVFDTMQHSFEKWGVGMARKTGMDEAVRRFDILNRPDGVILSLDADCTVSENYLLSVHDELLLRKDRSACSIYFEHPLSAEDTAPESIRYITFYELHLRYYLQALDYCGFPYDFHTVGSSMAVKSLCYIKVGGMNRKQAGEDFYFIQKLVSSGSYFSLNSTTVYPSSRASKRVPFGTGASMDKLTSEKSSTLLTYHPESFKELKAFFDLTGYLYESKVSDFTNYYYELPSGIRSFLDKDEWFEKMQEIRNNTSGLVSFKKRFFDWFNMFRIVKYLNYVHTEYFKKEPVEVAASALLEMKGIAFESQDPLDLLILYRSLERNQ